MVEINIVSLVNGKNTGDDNSARGIAEATATQLNSPRQEYNISDLSELQSEISNSRKQFFLIASGAHMLPILSKLKVQFPDKVQTSWSSHQIPEDLATYDNALDHINLPKHVVTDSFREKYNSKLIETIGVAHNTKAESLSAKANELQDKLQYANPYLLVILAGDAPDSDGKMKEFTPTDAAGLAKYISSFALDNNYTLLITNGPRTGKSQGSSHKEYESTDLVTQAFIDNLTVTKHELFDFKFREAGGVISAYQGLLGIIASDNSNAVFVPGESTATVSECCDFVNPNQVIIYQNAAMHSSHQSHIDSVFLANQAHYIDSGLTLNKRVDCGRNSPHQNAAEAVAETIISKLDIARFTSNLRTNTEHDIEIYTH